MTHSSTFSLFSSTFFLTEIVGENEGKTMRFSPSFQCITGETDNRIIRERKREKKRESESEISGHLSCRERKGAAAADRELSRN